MAEAKCTPLVLDKIVSREINSIFQMNKIKKNLIFYLMKEMGQTEEEKPPHLLIGLIMIQIMKSMIRI